MGRLVQKINFGYGDMFVYGEADFEANQAMQEPLQKLFNYEKLDAKGENDCKLCGSGFDFRKVLITNNFGDYSISLAGSSSQCNAENKFNFCPECGRKLTKENFDGHEI